MLLLFKNNKYLLSIFTLCNLERFETLRVDQEALNISH